MNKYSCALLIFALINLLSCKESQKNKLTDYVNPFIGTGGHGHTYPGATVPFGMVQLSPDTRLTGWDGCSGYHYSDSIIYGFSHTHLSGTGVSDYGDILLMPTTGKVNFTSGYVNEHTKTADGYGSTFKKSSEKATPGFYSVFLDDYKIKAELTASARCGVHKYTFPKNKEANIIIDLTHRDEVLNSKIEILSKTEVQGFRISKAWAKEQYIYFYATFSKEIENYESLINDSILGKEKHYEGNKIKTVLKFNTEDKEEITVRVGISAVSVDGAKKNLEKEVGKKTFDEIKQAAETLWNNELNKIIVEGGGETQKTIFYTALYHSLVVPNIFQDVDGKYRGTDLQIHEAAKNTNYTIFSLWDTYRSTHPLYTIIQQKRTLDFINTFLRQYEQMGSLPVWELAGNETGCMIGYHSVSVIADALAKGINNFDKEKALAAMIKSSKADKLGIPEQIKYGYIPSNLEHESVSKTLEYAYDDWCIAQTAKIMNKADVYAEYIERAQYYKNIFEPKTGFMRGKRDACWMQNFDPKEVNFRFTEANSWQYSFYAPQDISGLIQLLGGAEKFDKKLDKLFNASNKTTGRGQVDITGLIGQYAHGNEPSHHIAYLYNFAAKPWKTQEMVAKICREMYTDKPDGLIGNEDCGQMSAWYIMSAMGFYPVTPGTDYYVIGSPIFDKVTIHLENGKKFIITAENKSKDNFYIKSAELNGKNYTQSYIKHQDIVSGGRLDFVMSNKANKNWGTKKNDVPVSEISANKISTAPFVYADNFVFYDKLKIKLGTTSDNSKIYYTTNGSEPDENSKLYTGEFDIDRTSTIKLIGISENSRKSKTMHAKFTKVSKDVKLSLTFPFAQQYAAGGKDALIDGIIGAADFRLGDWQGFQEVDLEATLDYGSPQNFKEFSIRFLQDINAWVFMPKEVEFFVSKDGKNYRSAGIVKNDVAQDNWDIQIKNFKIKKAVSDVQYVKVVGRNIGKCPENHKAAGYKAWIFADEIQLK